MIDATDNIDIWQHTPKIPEINENFELGDRYAFYFILQWY